MAEGKGWHTRLACWLHGIPILQECTLQLMAHVHNYIIHIIQLLLSDYMVLYMYHNQTSTTAHVVSLLAAEMDAHIYIKTEL